ncbi:hypothetical protein SAMN04488062_12037 [Flavobacterium omnivorum]|uniref:Uncharacterized protein n=1 Tax=Flavobacterium omnivorum TaxID=178355 RepID=A0A1G8H649_9FLAO|nr:hypothetical protein [Flavobacterium omnivorum]SDI02105.1 hypothetical protein SAMN04488062_12037 [Flavobacterium omnivorum]
MSAKTKAKELVKQMYKHQWRADAKEFREAKECAKIAVDEILSLLTLYNEENAFNDLQTKKYWNQVKQEIDKL